MNLKEFLLQAFKSRLYRVLTRKQANYLKIPYPLEHGWLDRYGDRAIEDLDKMVSLFTEKQRRKCAFKIAKPKRKCDKIFLPDGDLNIEFILSDKFYNTREWRKLRYDALSKSDGRCCLCNMGKEHGKVLHVDHIRPKSLYPEEALDPDNLQVLCEDCNMGKGNTDTKDWRKK